MFQAWDIALEYLEVPGAQGHLMLETNAFDFQAYGLWQTAYGLWLTADSLRLMAYGLWLTHVAAHV
jgi:hypothetical protein